MRPRDLPNIISALRLLAVAPVVYCLETGAYGWALVLFTVAGVSDGVDGYLARHYGWQTRLGGILDPLADKALLVCCFVVLGLQGKIPLWLVGAAVFRDLLIMGGALVYHYRIGTFEAAPLLASKLNTLVQIVYVVAVIVDAGLQPLPAAWLAVLTWGCLATVLVSGAQYVWIWSHKAKRHEAHQTGGR